ncbi:MAG: hypothetical protein AB7F59_13095 [Bdellovibrionales bacterium]
MCCRVLFSLALVASSLLFSQPSFAQFGGSNRCDERRDEFNYQDRCEQITRRACEYNSRLSCYVSVNIQPVSRCEHRYDQYDSEYDCRIRFPEGCEYRSGCWVSRPIQPPPLPRCDPQYKEYDTQARCERMHEHGCRVEGQCWVPNPAPPPPPPPPAVCPHQDDDGSYEGRGRRGFRNQSICEISEGRRAGACEIRGDGCWHPRGR